MRRRGLYERFVLPRLVHLVCARSPQTAPRREVVPLASGAVLEIGFGSGLNLPHYDATRVDRVLALEPSAEMWRLAGPAVRDAPVPVEHVPAGAEAVPLASASVDSVVITYALCTVPDVAAALAEARRVLRPGGRLLFCEHGASPDAGVRRWQRRLDPVWSRLAGGCSLQRDVPALLTAAGFAVGPLAAGYVAGWRPASFTYRGVTVPR